MNIMTREDLSRYVTTKVCRICGIDKPAAEFYRRSRASDGLQSYCRPCHQGRVRGTEAVRRRSVPGRESGQRWEVGFTFGELTIDRVYSDGHATRRLDCSCSCGGRRDGIDAGHIPTMATWTCLTPLAHRETTPKTYDTAHAAIKGRYGSASAHQCQICGDQAQDWMFTHALAEPMHTAGPKRGPWSPDPRHYIPGCRACNQRTDNDVRNGTATSELLAWLQALAAMFWGNNP